MRAVAARRRVGSAAMGRLRLAVAHLILHAISTRCSNGFDRAPEVQFVNVAMAVGLVEKVRCGTVGLYLSGWSVTGGSFKCPSSADEVEWIGRADGVSFSFPQPWRLSRACG